MSATALDGSRRKRLPVAGDRQLRDPCQQVCLAEVVVGRDVIGADRKGVLEQPRGRDRLIAPEQRRSEVVSSRGVVRLEQHGLLEPHDRLVEVSLPPEQRGQQEVRLAVERVVLERKLQLAFGLLGVAAGGDASGLVVPLRWRHVLGRERHAAHPQRDRGPGAILLGFRSVIAVSSRLISRNSDLGPSRFSLKFPPVGS